jgi:3-oxoacyl-[acyl-carrier-protein] synthase II
LASSIGDGTEDHWTRFTDPLSLDPRMEKRAGHFVIPLAPVDFARHIQNRLDIKRWGAVQSLGVHTAGDALAHAGLKGARDLLARTVVVIAGTGGERDIAFDRSVFREPIRFEDSVELNRRIAAGTRPSLFLSQLPNLLAANISITFGVSGGSRTVMGEELAGVNALLIARRLVADGAFNLALVGASFTADREDLVLLYGFGSYLWRGDPVPVWSRAEAGGGLTLGSMGAFMVLEAAEHARARNADPLCRLVAITANHSRREAGAVACALSSGWEEIPAAAGSLGIISGATGVAPATDEEHSALSRHGAVPVRTPGSVVGHGMEASFPFNVALACLALQHGELYRPFPGDPQVPFPSRSVERVIVTSVGHWRGESSAILDHVGSQARCGMSRTSPAPAAGPDLRVRPEICITGMGLATSLGKGKDANWKALAAGRSGVQSIKRFNTDGLRTTIGATIDYHGLGPLPFVRRTELLARIVLEEALAQANLQIGKVRAPLFVGIPPAEMSWSERLALALEAGKRAPIDYEALVATTRGGDYVAFHEEYVLGGIGTRLAEHVGASGVPITVNTACATGATAIQLATEILRRREAEIAIVVAADASIVPDTIVRFSLLAALSMSNDPPEKAAKPFSLDRDGFVLGEGAAALVLESGRSAQARGRVPLAFVAGVGESADTYHLTRSNPDARASIEAMRAALLDAAIEPDAIDHINAHGTGTPENDRIEYLAIRALFHDRASCVPTSSNKSMIGHTMSAAGAVESVISVLAMQNGVIPPTINYQNPDPELALDVVPNIARSGEIRHVLSNSFGFGGQNVSLVLSRY